MEVGLIKNDNYIHSKGDTTDCRTETGITVSLIDTISFLVGQLMDRDLDNPDIQEALQDFSSRTKWASVPRKYTMLISIKKI